jgi:hypothetical protein
MFLGKSFGKKEKTRSRGNLNTEWFLPCFYVKGIIHSEMIGS